MLLDTMCNAFGGIILLAVLVTLLTSKEKQIESNASSDSQELAQRRLALGQTNLQKSLQLAASLQAKAGAEDWKQQVALLKARKEVQDTLLEVREAAARTSKEIDESGAIDPQLV